MKFKDSALLMAGETAAFGWFILRGISFVALVPLLPLGYLYYRLMRNRGHHLIFLNGLTLLAAVLIGSDILSRGLFQGEGRISLILLLIAAGIFGMNVEQMELRRVLRWWSVVFLVVFLAMLVATLPGIRLEKQLPHIGEWWEILIFYLLVFLEPLSLGKDYAGAPLALGVLLIPFGVASFYALGSGAFELAAYPYLSAWSGVTLLSAHHIEGVILGFYYGSVAFRGVEYFGSIFKKYCNRSKNMVE